MTFSYSIQPPSSWLYHLANIFLLLSYLSNHLLLLRLLLAAGCLCFGLWGLFVLAISIDTTVYNLFFFLINTAHAAHLIHQMRPVRLDGELEAVWRAMFDGKSGLLMSRRDWKVMTDDKEAHVRSMEAEEVFATRQSEQHTARTARRSGVGQSQTACHAAHRLPHLRSCGAQPDRSARSCRC